MIDVKKATASQIIMQEGHFVTAARLKQHGLNSYDIGQLVAGKSLERVKRGLYRWRQYREECNEMVEVANIVPKGVFCLHTAINYYELSTYIPKEYNIAILRTMRKPGLPDYPPIKVVYFSAERYYTGVSDIIIDDQKIPIYDLEKTVCDAVAYRNKLGIDIVREVMENYISRPDKKLQRLAGYAEKLRIARIMNTYLEILI